MSRFHKYAHALASGYVLLGVNVLFTFASVPLALRYLTKEEFGLWALTTQIAGYVGLVDAGMSAAVSRILVDYKDNRGTGDYGAVVQTAIWVNLAQGLAGLAVGAALVFVLPALLRVPASLQEDFQWVLFWQCTVLALSFAARTPALVLSAHQRTDVTNYAGAGALLVQLGVLWLCFSLGIGLFSLVWAYAALQVLTLGVGLVASWRLGLWPGRGEWGHATWSRFRELFAFAQDMFFYQLGSQLVNASQVILVSRLINLEAGAVWSICTRTYNVLFQVVARIFDASCPAMAEMLVRREVGHLANRFKSLIVLSASMAVLAGSWFAFANQPFVSWWTQGRIGWPASNDLLLAIYLVLAALVRAHTGLAGLTKEFRFLRYVYFLEGIFFVSVAWVIVPSGGVPAMLVISIMASLAFSFPYGTWRSSRFFGVPWAKVALGWIVPSLRLAGFLAAISLAAHYASAHLPPLVRLGISVLTPGTAGAFLLLRYGLDEATRAEVRARLSKWWPSW